MVILPVECVALRVFDCSVPETVSWPEPEIANCAPVPGSSTSMRRPRPSATDFRIFPTGSVTVVVLPEYEVVMPEPSLLHTRSEEHTSELQSRLHLVCRLL